MTNRKKIAEQIQRLYSRFKGERENVKPIFDVRELYLLIDQSINKILSVETRNSFREGNIEVPECSLILYENQAVTSNSGTAYVDLPVYPIRLPLDMGVWEITPANDPLNPLIPVPMQFAQLMQGTILDGLEQKHGYYIERGRTTSGPRVRFMTDITLATPPISSVDVRILVSDVGSLSDTDNLPLNADYEALVIADVLQIIGFGQVALTELKAQLSNGKE